MSLPTTDITPNPSERPSNSLPFVFEFGSQDPAAQSILWLHGLSGSHNQFNPLLPLFPGHPLHHILLDLPGHGTQVHSDFNYTDALDQICRIITERAHPGKCHLVGFSLGGNIALQLIRERPEFVEQHIDKIFVTGGTIGISRWILIFFYVGIPFTRIYLELLRFEFFQRGFEKVTGMRWSEELVRDMRAWNSFSRMFRWGMKFPPSFEGDDFVGKVDVELCLCMGSKEPLVKKILQVDEVMRRRVKGCRSFVAVGMVHMWDTQKPKKFVETVDKYFNGEALPAELIRIEEYFNTETGKQRKR